jgi:hypothetical protein
LNGTPLIPSADSLRRSCSALTVSKAADKSNAATTTTPNLLHDLIQPACAVARGVVHDFPL